MDSNENNQDNQNLYNQEPAPETATSNDNPYQYAAPENYDNNYQYNQQQNTAQDKKADDYAKLSLILGIVGLVLAFSCCCTFVSIIFSIAGLIFGIISKNSSGVRSSMAIGGIVCSGVAIFIFAAVIILSIISAVTGVTADVFNYGYF